MNVASGNRPIRFFHELLTVNSRLLTCFSLRRRALDAHAVERTVDEEEGDDEEGRRQNMRQSCTLLSGSQLHGKLNSQKAEQSRELDDWVERDGRRVLERIADGVSDHSSVVERRTFLLQFDFDNFLGVVPRAASVGHEDGLVQAE